MRWWTWRIWRLFQSRLFALFSSPHTTIVAVCPTGRTGSQIPMDLEESQFLISRRCSEHRMPMGSANIWLQMSMHPEQLFVCGPLQSPETSVWISMVHKCRSLKVVQTSSSIVHTTVSHKSVISTWTASVGRYISGMPHTRRLHLQRVYALYGSATSRIFIFTSSRFVCTMRVLL